MSNMPKIKELPKEPEGELPSRMEMLGGYMNNCMKASGLLNETIRRLVALGADRPEFQARASNANLFMQTSLMWLDSLAQSVADTIAKEDGNGENVRDQPASD